MAPYRPPPPPKILCTTENSIAVSYYRLGPDAQHDEAMQLISEHCDGGYIETKRLDNISWRTVYAMCLQTDDSPADSQPCEYDADEHVGFGEKDIATPDG